MSGLAGAVLLTVSTLPQAVRLVRTRSATDFSWGFIGFSFSGCALLVWHALRLGDAAFAIVNGSGLAFWSLVAVVRAAGRPLAEDTTAPPREGQRLRIPAVGLSPEPYKSRSSPRTPA